MATINSSFPPDRENIFDYFGNIGRAILGRSNKFIYNKEQFTRLNQKVILIDCSYGELISVAQNVPHLNTVITKGAEMFSNMELKHLDKDGNKIENSEIIKLLNKPNPLQSLEGFLYELYVYNAVYANNFIYKNYGSRLSDLPSLLWCLPPSEIKINLTGKIYRQIRIEDIIKNYVLYGDDTPFTSTEIIHIADGISSNAINAKSKIESLQIPLSNIIAALKSTNIILTERGLIGFISNEGNKDGDGALPMDEKERKRIEDQYQSDRSLDSKRSHVLISTANLKWIPMTFDMGQLKLYEGLEDAFANICAAYGIDRDIFPSTKGATNENKKQGLITTYQNTIQPLANKVVNVFAEQFKITERGERLVADYSWLPVMQEDKVKEQATEKTKAEMLSILVDKGIISREAFAEMMGVELSGSPQSGSDSLGKIPLALQQLALARERANTVGDTALSVSIGEAMDVLTAQMVNTVIAPTQTT